MGQKCWHLLVESLVSLNRNVSTHQERLSKCQESWSHLGLLSCSRCFALVVLDSMLWSSYLGLGLGLSLGLVVLVLLSRSCCLGLILVLFSSSSQSCLDLGLVLILVLVSQSRSHCLGLNLVLVSSFWPCSLALALLDLTPVLISSFCPCFLGLGLGLGPVSSFRLLRPPSLAM